MNCLDCLTGQHLDVLAVGVCVDCGAAMCLEHAYIEVVHRTTVVPLNRVVQVEPPARLLTCMTCAAARQAAGVASTHQGRLPHGR
ncbi:DUF2180 family protein [Nonomuraea sp. NPDC003709]|uniref:DUF2180 family protein n=1 Tax=Nonomuraea sp. NPDC003709 TaxID=3154450 RepID=UPI0033AC7A9C